MAGEFLFKEDHGKDGGEHRHDRQDERGAGHRGVIHAQVLKGKVQRRAGQPKEQKDGLENVFEMESLAGGQRGQHDEGDDEAQQGQLQRSDLLQQQLGNDEG